DDAEVAAAAAQRPQQVGVLVGVGADDAPVGGDQLGREQVVAGEAVLALQPAGAAAHREAGDAGGRHAAAGGGEAVRGRGAVGGRPGGAAADAHAPGLRVDRDLVHRTDVEDEAVLHQGAAGDRVAAGADADGQVVVAGERERRDDVGGRRAPGDQPRADL